ncbi:AbgT family transporter [Brevibacterium salitolerans]|uniref:AbgT family transporter n=1 Tax=Brevibacterium salitolerans TaxID=1403566 RepID=A0ABP5HXZ4_9MICO
MPIAEAKQQEPREEKLGFLMRALIVIEKAGNKLPHPFWLFLGLAAVVMVLSWALSEAGVFAINPADGEEVRPTNLLAPEELRTFLSGIVDNFVNFPPLGLVLAVLFGVAVAEQSGLIRTVMKVTLRSASPRLVTFVVALVGSAGSMASDASYMIVIPLGGVAFAAVGRNPIIGIAVAYASVSGGYAAAPFVNAYDAILAGLTTSAAHIIDDSYVVSPISNLFFNFVSMFVVATAITLVTELLLNKRGEQLTIDESALQNSAEHVDFAEGVSAAEKRGLWAAGVTLVASAVLIVLLCLPAGSALRDEAGAFGPESGLMAGIAPIVGFGFFLVGIVYGVVTRSITRFMDVPEMMVEGVRPFAQVLVLFFAAAQFLAVFNSSSLGQILAIRGAEFFRSIEANTFVVLLGGFLIVALGALLVTSGSGLWTLLGPILVPMFMLLSISPETTQALYRIGDSTTNIISPMSPFFVVVLGFIQKYKRDAGIGTLLSLTIPLSFGLWVLWGVLFFVWWALGIPWGPGSPIAYTP